VTAPVGQGLGGHDVAAGLASVLSCFLACPREMLMGYRTVE